MLNVVRMTYDPVIIFIKRLSDRVAIGKLALIKEVGTNGSPMLIMCLYDGLRLTHDNPFINHLGYL